MSAMPHFQHASDATVVDNDGPIYVAGSRRILDTTQAANEIKKPDPVPERQPTLGPSSLPSYIPFIDEKEELRQAKLQLRRMLVICFDGTGDQFDDDNSNIVQLVSMLKKDDKTKQMVYYQAGIGTYTSRIFVTPLMITLSKKLDAMFGWNLDSHIISGYEFLMQNYRPGDKICIFGFSRGAYTARSLATMIHKVGIIPADNHQQLPFAYTMYARIDDIGWAQANAFKKTFSADVDIEFVGVWDTVGSVIKSRSFSLSGIKTFRHAVSLDEHRSKFNPVQTVLPETNGEPMDAEEVWFAGCHCDIGGGSVKNWDGRNSLARIPLRWMVRECFKAKTGILFDTASLSEIGIDPTTLYPRVPTRYPRVFGRPPLSDSLIARARERVIQMPKPVPWSEWLKSWFTSSATRPPNSSQPVPFFSEDDEDLQDALSPKYDQMEINRLWWVLEIFPMKRSYQTSDNKWVTYHACNMGKARYIHQQRSLGVKVHRSVKLRMEAQYNDGTKYEPLKKLVVEPTWI